MFVDARADVLDTHVFIDYAAVIEAAPILPQFNL